MVSTAKSNHVRTVGLVNLETIDAVFGVTVLELVLLLLGRVPEPSVVNGGNVKILSDTLDPDGETVDRRSIRFGH